MRVYTKLFETLPKTIYFWLPLIAIAVNYGLFGYLLRVLIVTSANPITLGLLLALAIGNTWALTLGNGGLVATILALGLGFKTGGVNLGGIAIACAGCMMWLGFFHTDQERVSEQKLSIGEILSTVVIVIWAVVGTLGIYEIISGITAAVVLGAIAGSYSVIGNQIKASGITHIQSLQLIGNIAGIGLAIGWIYAWLTFKVFIPS
ncbi:hypothetical protein Syn7502_01378 [Synechococcus sp. PCC 7502]|uniref:hypothetical protein n=1 Tax=Synechococcus sp. PCC 7502 TaxID=1173263 RepID=UPI00029FAF75|nr:hypothetical protein [Synechococcus sp. PCC 7502]AFY73465.1 hypothetical protein Syn7502_01378 [Synechococcus sp. PCC 7502]